MPPRDEQDYEGRRQQIIDGALEIFARDGFAKATNKDIARAAGIGSPGLIYHYFKDKADLFYQVVAERIPMLRLLDHPDDLLSRPPREALTLFARTLLSSLETPFGVRMMRLVLGEALRHPQVAQMFSEIGPGRALRLLAGYLEQQMEAGLLRRADPHVAARCFVGPLIAYLFTREILLQPEARAIDLDTMAATTVEIFLQGLEASP